MANFKFPCKDPLVNAIRKYELHPSILKIKSVFALIRLFDFSFVSSDDFSKIITSLDSTKRTSGVIPTKIVNLLNRKICKDLGNCINESIKKNEFPNELKAGDIKPIFEKEDPIKKENYKPVSGLPKEYLKEYYLLNLQNFQISFFLAFYVVLEKGTALNMRP